MTTSPIGIACAFMSLALWLYALVAHPTAARCPRNWWLPEGARLVCRPKPVGVDERDARGVLIDRSVQPPGEIWLYLDCPEADVRQDGEQAWCAP